MEKYLKFLRKLEPDIREKLLTVIQQLADGHYEGLDIKKLRGTTDDLYRVRVGTIRIIFRKTSQGATIYRIEYRGGAYK